jgi:REP element-mobilizing transposase RayT
MLAYHIVFGTHAHWLPNDERGSWSAYVRNKQLREFGEATKVNTRQSLAHHSFDKTRRRQMEAVLQYPPVRLTEVQILQVAKGFAQAAEESGYTVFACAVMPTHSHLVVAVHRYEPRRIMGHFKGRATQCLNWKTISPLASGLAPTQTTKLPPSPWAQKGWVVYLDTEQQIRNAIDYVNRNPVGDGLSPQHWDFVAPYK